MTSKLLLRNRCLSVHTGGGGYPSPRFFPRSLAPGPGVGGYPSPGWGEVPGVPPDRTGLGYPPARSGWGSPDRTRLGYPPSQVRMDYPSQDRTGVLPSQVRMGYPPTRTEQQSQHLLHYGRYASCIHAGGLSYSFFFFVFFGQHLQV